MTAQVPDVSGRDLPGWAPGGPRSFRFDEHVTGVFDQMLRDSVPGYKTMRSLVAQVAARHLPAGGALLDLGASRGEAAAPHTSRAGAVTLVESSAPMRDALHGRFGASPHVTVLDTDLRTAWPDTAGPGTQDVVLSVLTLQFIPIEHRQHLLARAATSLAPGGALIVVEKVLGDGADADRMLRALHDGHKEAEGHSAESIRANLLALEGVLVPVTARWNEDMLRTAGLHPECFWRQANFAAWAAVPAHRP